MGDNRKNPAPYSGLDGMVLLGRIGAAKGLRGEVLVRSFTAVPEDIDAYGPLTTRDGRNRYVVNVVRTVKQDVVVRIEGIDNRTAAEALHGVELFIARNQLPPPGEDEFYHADLIGLCVQDTKHAPIGKVLAVQNFGAGDLLEIALNNLPGDKISGTTRTQLLAFTKDFVPLIDFPGRRIVINPPEGWPE